MVDPLPETERETGTPRWVKVFAIGIIAAVVLIGVMLISGHGPGQHVPAGQPTPPAGGSP